MSHHNKVILGDCQTGLKLLTDNSVDLTVTSPPYDDLRSYNKVLWNFDVFKTIATELYRVTAPGGVLVWIVNDSVKKGSESGTSFRQALYFMEVGFKLHDTMIFEKNTSSFPARRNGNRYTQIFEYMFVLVKGKIKTTHLICDKENRWKGYTNFGKNTNRQSDDSLKVVKDIKPVPEFSPRNNIWKYQVNYGYSTKDKDAHKHPAIFPEKLAEDHILSWSNEGDCVLDPFSGSGTTLKMAQANKRCFIGIEINETYVDIIQKRLNIEREALVIETDNFISKTIKEELISDASSSTNHEDHSTSLNE
jgi:DNA modification methylase